MDELIFLLIIVTLAIVILSIKRVNIKRGKSNLIVIIYETDLEHPNLQHFKASLKKHGYNYVILSDKKWEGFGAKIKRINRYLRQLDPNQLVLVSDARDVLAVNFKSTDFVSAISKVDIEHKVVVSTEIGCCVPTAFKPGELRSTSGRVLHRTYDGIAANKKNNNSDSVWKKMFAQRAQKHNIEHPVSHKQSIYLNAGIYCGKAGNIRHIYEKMNITDKEDDQLLMSEVFYHFPNKFYMDYNRDFFSNSHVWDSNNNKSFQEDTGCFYERHNDKILDAYLQKTPYFIHTPGKHFKCYDFILKNS